MLPLRRCVRCVQRHPTTRTVKLRQLWPTIGNVACLHRCLITTGSRVKSEDTAEDEGTAGNEKTALPPPPLDQGEGKSDQRSLRETLARLDGTTRYQLVVIAGGTCVMSLGLGTIAPILPCFASQWGDVGATGVGLVLAAPALAKLLLNNASGRRADTHGRVPMMVSGGLITAVGSMCTAVASSIPSVCGSRLLVGMGFAANGPASQAYLADVTGKFPQHRGAIMGTLGSIGVLSYGLGPAVGGLLAESWGPGACFGLVGAAAALCAAFEATLPETLTRKKAAQARGADSSGGGENVLSVSTLLEEIPRLKGILVMDAAIFIGWAVWLGIVPLHAVAVWDATPGSLGVMFSVMSVAGAAGAPLGGMLSDKFGRDAVIMGGATCCALSTALLPFADSMLTFGTFLVFWDFGEGVAVAGLTALAAECAADKHRGQVFALRSQVDSAIFLAAPVAVGVLADTAGLGAAFYVSTTTMVGAMVAFRLFQPSGVK